MAHPGEMFRTGEVVLIHFKNEPTLFARIENIAADRKKGWWQVTLLTLTLPLQSMTWILDKDQLSGADFTMQGNPIRMERVEAESQNIKVAQPESPEIEPERKADGARIVPMFGDED